MTHNTLTPEIETPSKSVRSRPKTFRCFDIKVGQERELNPAEIASHFAAYGVVILPDFYSSAELNGVRREMDDHYAGLLGQQQGTEPHDHAKEFACDVVPWEPVQLGNTVFCEFHAHPKLAAITEIVLGAGFSDPGSLVMYSIAGGRGQAWHQDCPPQDIDRVNLNRLIYTEDVREEDGALIFVPGSHLRGRIPPGGHQDAIDGEMTLLPKAGTLVLLNGHVYHRVTPNEGNKPRLSINFRAFPSGIPDSVTCIGIYRNGSVNFCDKPKHHDGTPA